MRDDYDFMEAYDKSLRKGKYIVHLKYESGKITYGKYIYELKNNYYEILDSDEWKEVNEYEKQILEKQKAIDAQESLLRRYKLKEKEKRQKELKAIWTVISWILLIIAIVAGLTK